MGEAPGPAGGSHSRKRRLGGEKIELPPLVDPLLDRRDHLRAERGLPERHRLPVDVAALELSHQQARGSFAGDDRRPVGAPTEQGLKRHHGEIAVGLHRVVAATALFDEHRSDLKGKRHVPRLEFLRPCWGCRRRGGGPRILQRHQRIGAIEHRSLVDPRDQQSALVGRHLAAAARHVAGADHLDEAAVRPGPLLHHPGLHERVVGGELEISPPAGNMTSPAMAHEDRGDLLDEAHGGRGRALDPRSGGLAAAPLPRSPDRPLARLRRGLPLRLGRRPRQRGEHDRIDFDSLKLEIVAQRPGAVEQSTGRCRRWLRADKRRERVDRLHEPVAGGPGAFRIEVLAHAIEQRLHDGSRRQRVIRSAPGHGGHKRRRERCQDHHGQPSTADAMGSRNHACANHDPLPLEAHQIPAKNAPKARSSDPTLQAYGAQAGKVTVRCRTSAGGRAGRFPFRRLLPLTLTVNGAASKGSSAVGTRASSDASIAAPSKDVPTPPAASAGTITRVSQRGQTIDVPCQRAGT